MPDRRLATRIPVHKSARVHCYGWRGAPKCMISDLSATGAHLLFPFAFGISDNLTLTIPGDNLVLQAEVRWRQGRECGIQFQRRIAHPLLTLNRMRPAGEIAQYA
ncbi:MAG: PilZ domain-containing protein [Hyphomicrobiales bacterium]